MSSLMVLLIANTCELALAVLALVWLLTGVRPHMYHQVALLGEGSPALSIKALEQLET
jgi:hypothetical protein